MIVNEPGRSSGLASVEYLPDPLKNSGMKIQQLMEERLVGRS